MNNKMTCVIKKGKDRTKTLDNINLLLVYKIPCSNCDTSYIGESKHTLSNRLEDHKRDVRNKCINKLYQCIALTTNDFFEFFLF